MEHFPKLNCCFVYSGVNCLFAHCVFGRIIKSRGRGRAGPERKEIGSVEERRLKVVTFAHVGWGGLGRWVSHSWRLNKFLCKIGASVHSTQFLLPPSQADLPSYMKVRG